MTSFEQQIRDSLADLADTTPVASSPRFDPLRSPSTIDETDHSRWRRPMAIAASVALVVTGVAAVALLGFRDQHEPADAPWSLSVEPNVVEPGAWVALTGDTHWGWEAFLDQGDGENRERIWMLYPASDTSLTPQPPVDLREDPNAGILPIWALNPMNNFQISRRIEPGDYQICRVAVNADAELCAGLTIIDPAAMP